MAATATLDTPIDKIAPAVRTDEEILLPLLRDVARLYAKPDDFETILVCDSRGGNYLLLDQGWDGFKRIHQTWVHIQLKDGKFWIQEDRTQDGIAVDLMHAGVPADRIVLAFQHPSRRKYGDFAAE